MTGALAMGVSLTVASALPNKVEAATPKMGGRLRAGLTGGATTDALDPGQILDLYMVHLQFGQFRNGLTEVTANGELVSELAESWIFSQIYAAEASWNDTYWKNNKFNKLMVEARAELETNKRRSMYVEMQQILHNDGGLILPLFQSNVMVYNQRVGVPEVVGNNWQLDGAKQAERWWFS